MTSDFRYEIKNFITCYQTWKYWLEKFGRSVRNERHTVTLILVDPVDDEEVEEILQRLTMRSKEMEEYYSLILIDRSSLLSLYWLGNRMQILNLVIIYQWSQITFLLLIRLTGSQQIDFKVLSLWGRNILESLSSEIDRVNLHKYFLKVNKYFLNVNKLTMITE